MGMIYIKAIGFEAKAVSGRDGSFTLSVPKYPAYNFYARRLGDQKFNGSATVDRRKPTDDFEIVIVMKQQKLIQPPEPMPHSVRPEGLRPLAAWLI